VTEHQEFVLEDINVRGRTFLAGEAPKDAEVRSGFDRPVLMDGLTREEVDLMLSVLPSGARRLWLQPLDKGLSGSKVFSARYDMGPGTARSKAYALKVGDLGKIDREYTAIEKHVAPFVNAIGQPIYRRGRRLGLVAQEIVGLAEDSSLESLRNIARKSPVAGRVVHRLLAERLGRWYLPPRPVIADFVLGDVFGPYVRKGPSLLDGTFPPRWDRLHEWVASECGRAWEEMNTTVEEVQRRTISCRQTTVHGDLHSQNVLVDRTGECWPIDFAWTKPDACPLVDLVMLECSLKFLAIPMRSDLRSLLPIENALAQQYEPSIAVDGVPYSEEISNVVRTVLAVRTFGRDEVGIDFDDYIAGLSLMTLALANHQGLNTPFVIASLQVLCGQR
jgi:hypothetical protein